MGQEAVAAYLLAKASSLDLQVVDMFFSQAQEISWTDPSFLGFLDVLVAFGIISEEKRASLADENYVYSFLTTNGFSDSIISKDDPPAEDPTIGMRSFFVAIPDEVGPAFVHWATGYCTETAYITRSGNQAIVKTHGDFTAPGAQEG